MPLVLYFNLFFWMSDSLAHPTRTIGFVLLALLTCLLIAVDLLRFQNESFRDFFYGIIGPLMKEEEINRFNGTVPYFLSCVILFCCFSKEVIFISCILLMLGDPAAAYFGGKYGRIRFWNGKSLEGLAAFVIMGFFSSMLFLALQTWNASTKLALFGKLFWPLTFTAFSAALISALAELFSRTALKGLLDDNLWVPLAGALGFGIIGHLFGLPLDAIFFDPGTLFR